MTIPRVWDMITRRGKRPWLLEVRSSVTFILLMVATAVFTVRIVWEKVRICKLVLKCDPRISFPMPSSCLYYHMSWSHGLVFVKVKVREDFFR